MTESKKFSKESDELDNLMVQLALSQSLKPQKRIDKVEEIILKVKEIAKGLR